jgi:Flp pilus assembly protein TadD
MRSNASVHRIQPWRVSGLGWRRLAVLALAGVVASGSTVHAGGRSASRLVNRGVQLAADERWTHALAAFREAAARDPRLVEAHLDLGVALVRVGQHEEGTRSLRRALQLDPALAEAHAALGLSLLATSRPEDAAAELAAAARLAPGDAVVHYNLGVAFERAGNRERALRAWERSAEIQPAFAAAVKARNQARTGRR